jgi:hypothetical protein
MGAVWLHRLPAECAARGLFLATYPGWELRSRSSGGFDEVRGVVWHHTASPPTWTSERNMSYQWLESSTRPVANLYLGRGGDITLGAAGASNHAGAGGPVTTSKGVVGLDQGNRYLIGIEAGNTGTGEVWPSAQLAMYETITEIICEVYGLDPARDVLLHNTWAPDRKIDAAGPTPARPTWGGTSGTRTWNITAVRNDLVDQDMTPIKPSRVYDSRNHGAFAAGEVRRVPVVVGYQASIGGGCQGGTGWWGYSPDGDFSSPTSFVNVVDNGQWHSWGAIPVLAPGGHVYIKSHAGGHIYIDTYAEKK